MADLPIMLRIDGRRCVVIGGGAVAARRVASLLACGAHIHIIAPKIDPALEAQLDDRATWQRRGYQRGDLRGALLAVIATDDAQVNAAAAAEAREHGVLINRADDPEAGDFAVPAHAHHGPLTVAVHTAGISASLAASLRRRLSAALDPDVPRLLELVGPYRTTIQQAITDPAARRAALRRLADDEALALLKARGAEAVRRRCESLVKNEPPAA